jgi:hypothetical protein
MNAESNPSTQWKERVDPEEDGRFHKYAEALHTLQLKNAKGGPPTRTLHAKGVLDLLAEFTVLSDLPDYARRGLFAKGGTFRAYVRFSNGSPVAGSDRNPDVRGIAIKLLGVTGLKIIPGMEDAPTQDFLMIRDAALPFKNADEFAPFILAAVSPLTRFPGLIFKFGLSRIFRILGQAKKGASRPMVSLATTAFFSAAPIAFGPNAIQYGLKPQAVDGPGAQPGQSDNYLAEELSARLKQGPVHYDFGARFYQDEVLTPIEDASIEWKESSARFVPLARLTLLPQDPASAKGQKLHDFIEKLSFDPWHALTEFRPLGSMMRARRVAYKVSVKERQAAPEPDGKETFE